MTIFIQCSWPATCFWEANATEFRDVFARYFMDSYVISGLKSWITQLYVAVVKGLIHSFDLNRIFLSGSLVSLIFWNKKRDSEALHRQRDNVRWKRNMSHQYYMHSDVCVTGTVLRLLYIDIYTYIYVNIDRYISVNIDKYISVNIAQRKTAIYVSMRVAPRKDVFKISLEFLKQNHNRT